MGASNSPRLIVHREEWANKTAQLPRADHGGFGDRYSIPVLSIFVERGQWDGHINVNQVRFMRYPLFINGKKRWAWALDCDWQVHLLDEPLPFMLPESGRVLQ